MGIFARKKMEYPDDETKQLRRRLADAEERIRALEEQGERSRLLDAVIQGIAEPILVIDKNYNILLKNSAADGFWGIPQNGKNYKCHEASHGLDKPCDRKDWPCPLRGVLDTGRPVRVVHEHRGAHGLRQYEVLASPLVLPPGEIAGIIETARDITESRLAAEELEKAKSRLQFLTDNNPAVLYASRLGGEWGATFISKNIKEVLGYEPEDFYGSPSFWADHIHPDDRERVISQAERIFDNEVVKYEYRFMHRDGSWRWMHDEIKLVRDAEGRPAECIGYWIDVTARKQAEEDLRESEERFRSLFENSLDAIILTSQDGRYYAANPAACRMLGYAEDELVRAGRDGIVDHSDPNLAGYLKDRETKGRARAELTLIRKDGSKFPAEVSASVFTDREGRPRASVIMRDITRRRKAEEDLRKFQFILENAGEEFYLMDFSGNFYFANHTALRSLGYSKDELLGMHLSEIDPNYDRIRIPGHFEDLKRGDVPPFETVHKTKDGRLVPKEVKSVYLEIGGTDYICSFVRDVSERKALERQRNDFLAMITHDLKSPLTVVLGYSQLIKAEAENRSLAEMGGMAGVINQSGERLLRLVEDFLTVSKVQAGKFELRKAPADLMAMLQKVQDEYKPQAEEKGLSWTVGLPRQPLPKIDLDGQQVERVLGNLVQNAFNYTPGGGSVTLSLEESQREGRRYAKVAVSDTGRGIPKDERDKVFSQYYRSARTAGIKGSGLGLTIVKAVTEAHGGWIELESEPGKGSTFIVYLPI